MVGLLFAQGPTHSSKKTGYNMKMRINNVGAIGHVAYPPFNAGTPGGQPVDSLGLEYPIGARVEHLYGGGLWIAGLLDTSASGTAPPLRLVSVSYEGWSGPFFEFYPGNTPADTMWRARKGQEKPAGWDAYWGNSLSYRPISDEDFYCTFTDTAVRVAGHVPLGLKVIQSSYAWEDPYADGIIIFEYKIINMGRKLIDSAYVGYFFEADVGPTIVASFWNNNFSAFIANSFVAYVHNPINSGSTPVGAVLLETTIPRLDLQKTFQWFPGGQTPATDPAKYALMSLNQIKPDEYPALSDTRFLFSFGPFSMAPRTATEDPETLKVAIAVVSGYSKRKDHRIVLQDNAARALDIYRNQGIALPATPPSPPLRVNVGFRRIELDWKWRAGDDVLYGRNDPELNWDSTSQVAPFFPSRITNPPPGYDSTKGGRNFESYRLWRSENPDYPDASFTLLKQFDVREDDNDTLKFEFETGLEYTFVDSNLVRGKTYVYSITSRAIPNLVYTTVPAGDTLIEVPVPVQPLESGRRVNAVRVDLPFAVSKELNKVSVVPNPYRTDRDYTLESGGFEGLAGNWDENRRVIKFINLPEVSTIRIFSLSGDLIRTIQHDGRDATGIARGDHDMALVSESNRALASGVYVFTVESTLGTQTGKFVIIR
ncbi:MAG: T9SS type A sorting domain-containing protein [Bacteroidota bacterium]